MIVGVRTRVGERGARQPRLAMVERAHPVEEVRDDRRARRGGRGRLLEGRAGMPQHDAHAARYEHARELAERVGFGCEGDHRDLARVRVEQLRGPLEVAGPDQRRVVRAGRAAEEGPFQMRAEDRGRRRRAVARETPRLCDALEPRLVVARRAARDRRAERGDAPLHQEGRELDDLRGSGGRQIDTAETVDLEVDVAGREDRRAQVDRARGGVAGAAVDDHLAVDGDPARARPVESRQAGPVGPEDRGHGPGGPPGDPAPGDPAPEDPAPEDPAPEDPAWPFEPDAGGRGGRHPLIATRRRTSPHIVRGTRVQIGVRAGRRSSTWAGSSATASPARSARRTSSVSNRSTPKRHCSARLSTSARRIAFIPCVSETPRPKPGAQQHAERHGHDAPAQRPLVGRALGALRRHDDRRTAGCTHPLHGLGQEGEVVVVDVEIDDDIAPRVEEAGAQRVAVVGHRALERAHGIVGGGEPVREVECPVRRSVLDDQHLERLAPGAEAGGHVADRLLEEAGFVERRHDHAEHHVDPGSAHHAA